MHRGFGFGKYEVAFNFLIGQGFGSIIKPMKKFLLLLAFLSVIHPSFASYYTSSETIEKIDKETKDCIDTHYQTDHTMMVCVYKGYEKYNQEIKKTIEGAKEILPKAEYEELLKSQEKWEEFVKQHNILLKQTYEKNCPPFLPCLTASSDKYEYIKTRIKDLSGFLWLYVFYKQEGILDDELNFQEFSHGKKTK